MECNVCYGTHDKEIHEATLRVRQWFKDQVLLGKVQLPDRPDYHSPNRSGLKANPDYIRRHGGKSVETKPVEVPVVEEEEIDQPEVQDLVEVVSSLES